MLRSTKRFALVWADFSKRLSLLRVADDAVRENVLHSIPAFTGPASITNRGQRWGYHQPEQINETFDLAMEILQENAGKQFAELETLQQKLETATEDKKAGIFQRIENVKLAAERFNPEVLYNVLTNAEQAQDLSQPIYRAFAKKKWMEHDRMLTMQRMEQLHMIPDTLPTVNPTADIKVKFPHNQTSEFALWVEPGTVMPASAVAQPPTVKINQFTTAKGLYTVVLVNPDTPDLQNNSFSTSLHWGVANIEIDQSSFELGSKWQLENDDKVFKQYVPLTPENNTGNQRGCLWVLQQQGPIDVSIGDGQDFNIRQFVADHQLTPIGGHLWRQAFDRLVEGVRQQYGLGKGRVFHRVRKAEPMV